MPENRHSIFIEASAAEIFPQILLWGEANWWPEKSQMRFIKETSGDINVGTRYIQKVLLPFAPQWEVEVDCIVSNQKVGRKFLNGIFNGREYVELEPTAIGTKVNYVMNFEINGSVHKVLWNLFFRKLHDRNLTMILSSLKDFITKNK